VLEEQPNGAWAITALNNRSYGYMPGREPWLAAEVYPLEDTWAEILAVLRGY
jgi:hypothetical protein